MQAPIDLLAVVTAHLSPHRMQAPIDLLAVVTASLCEVRWASPPFFCNMGTLMQVINHVTEKPGIYQAMLYIYGVAFVITYMLSTIMFYAFLCLCWSLLRSARSIPGVQHNGGTAPMMHAMRHAMCMKCGSHRPLYKVGSFPDHHARKTNHYTAATNNSASGIYIPSGLEYGLSLS
jgi:hypothetical protein